MEPALEVQHVVVVGVDAAAAVDVVVAEVGANLAHARTFLRKYALYSTSLSPIPSFHMSIPF